MDDERDRFRPRLRTPGHAAGVAPPMQYQELDRRIRDAIHTSPDLARRLIEEYAARAEADAEPRRIAEAQLRRAQLANVCGDLEDSARDYEAARASFKRLRDADRATACDLGVVSIYALLGRKRDTRATMRRLRALGGDAARLASVEISIGNALTLLGDDASAEQSFRTALRHLGRRRKPDRIAFLRAAARANLANSLARRGAIRDALAETEAAHRFYADRDMAAMRDVVRLNRGWTLGLCGEIASALDDLRGAAAALDESGDAHRAALARLDEAELRLRLGDHTGAAKGAATAGRQLRACKAPIEAARADLVAARATLGTGDRARGRRLARRAAQAYAAAGSDVGVARANILLGKDVAAAEERLLAAGHTIAALEGLLANARALPQPEAAALLDERAALYPRTLRRWCEPEIRFLRAPASGTPRIRALRAAYRAAERVRGLAPSAALRACTLNAHLSIYEALAGALLERGRKPDRREAFLVLDAARARTLREHLERDAPGLSESAEVQRLREQLQHLWETLEHREGEGLDLRGAHVQVLREVTRCERALVTQMEQSGVALRLERPASQLPTEACLAFSVLDDHVTAFLSVLGDVVAWDCGPLVDLTELVEGFRFQVIRRLHGVLDPDNALSCLGRLGARLLDGAPPTLRAKRLRVVLPAPLGDVPIEALPFAGEPLGTTTAVAYAPFACVTPEPLATRRAAVIVGVESDGLPAVAAEIDEVAARLPGADVLRGPEATQRRILESLGTHRIIHIAGHAWARDDFPVLSALRVRDGWITASDLQATNLRGALVVLSACRTGDPSIEWRGEAFAGFPRALLAAGAGAVVASRWEVPDDVAHDFMRHFYPALLARCPPRAALHRAAMAVREAHPHPAAWTAFLLVEGCAPAA